MVRRRTLAERAAFVTAIVGIAVGALFLFAPIHGWCRTTITATPMPPGATPAAADGAPQVCDTEALWQRQQLFPMPFFGVLVWSVAPGVAYIGVRLRRSRRRDWGTGLMVLGSVVALTGIISSGAGPYFFPLVRCRHSSPRSSRSGRREWDN
jgi:hypothetical protein